MDKVFEIFEREDIPAHVRSVGAYLTERLEELAADCEAVKARRGLGLMQGLELAVPVGEVVKKAQQQGLIVIIAGNNVLRLVPPLIIEKEHVDEMMTKLKAALNS